MTGTLLRFVRLMESEKRFSKNYSRIKLFEHLRAHPDDRALRTISHVLLDEVQEVVHEDLMVMRQIARRSSGWERSAPTLKTWATNPRT